MGSDIMSLPVQHGLCDCCEEPGTAIKAYCCPCLVAGDTSDRLGDSYMLGCCMIFCFGNLGAGVLRHSHLTKMNKSEGFAMDCCIGCCLPCCSLVQCRREAEHYNTGTNVVLIAPTQTIIHTQQPIIHTTTTPAYAVQKAYPPQNVYPQH
eukprot:GDKJ01004712.1.p2 GENE.GDKJ01004712.1~~GDKJ01004712.1.p2  ORF type:complete len:150 (+),score=21.75 GDKJ01004712.1:1-450(+)